MVIAALICFIALLLAWIVAPDDATAEPLARPFEAEAVAAA